MSMRMPSLRQKSDHARSKIWLRGRKHTDVSASERVSRRMWCIARAALKQLWGRIAPLGSPVVPEV